MLLHGLKVVYMAFHDSYALNVQLHAPSFPCATTETEYAHELYFMS